MSSSYVVGLDYGTNSVRCLIVRAQDGFEAGSHVFHYPRGEAGIMLDSDDPELARQHPADYLEGAIRAVVGAVEQAKENDREFQPELIEGIGVDTTGSTPIPVDENGAPLAFMKEFADHPAAMAWLWKDHTSFEEAALITQTAARLRPQYLAKCGGVYSSEWFFSKALHCRNTAPEVFAAAHSWLECADWIPATLAGDTRPHQIRASVCAAGHKAMYSDTWGGYPDAEFLARVHPDLGRLRERLPQRAYTVREAAGRLSSEWAQKLGLREGIPIAVGAFDAHLGAVGAGIRPGALVKVLGTSSCDMMVCPNTTSLADIPGVCGIVDGSILPEFFGIEAGQSAVGDLFNWFVQSIEPGGAEVGSHEALTAAAAQLVPGESGLLALDWHNGNRSVLVDPRLSGLVVGMSLRTRPAEIYRALIEATAMGALMIINRIEEYGVKVEQVVNCGGIAEKNPMVMQIYADVTGRPMALSRSSQTCALGAAMAGAVVSGVHPGFSEAQTAMSGLKETVFRPDTGNHAVYRELFALYSQLHDAFGADQYSGKLHNVMKNLLDIRDRQRGL